MSDYTIKATIDEDSGLTTYRGVCDRCTYAEHDDTHTDRDALQLVDGALFQHIMSGECSAVSS